MRPAKTENRRGIDRGIEMKLLMGAAASGRAAGKHLLERICGIGRNSEIMKRQLDGILVNAVRIEIDDDDHNVGQI
jgi:hypothetical protein